MKKIYLIIVLVFTVGAGLGFSVNVSGEEALIPSWIKTMAGFWVENQIGDQEFIQALQYLVKEGILVIPTSDNSPPNPQKDSSPNTWNQVIVLSSSNSKKTDTFKISGEKWRFTWSCKAENEYDMINITIYQPNSDIPVDFLLMQKCPPTEETTYVYKDSGEYYFDIASGNISIWTITVEEFLK